MQALGANFSFDLTEERLGRSELETLCRAWRAYGTVSFNLCIFLFPNSVMILTNLGGTVVPA
jgi:hypothetical protein